MSNTDFNKVMNRERKSRSRDRLNVDLKGVIEEEGESEVDRILFLDPDECFAEEQVRTKFDEHSIKNLAENMRQVGQEQPIVVYPKNEDGLYRIDKGERRWRASKLIPEFKVMAMIRKRGDVDDAESIVSQLSENVQREDLDFVDLSISMTNLIEVHSYKKSDIASKMGFLSQSGNLDLAKVTRILSVVKLDKKGIQLVKDKVVNDLQTIDVLRKIREKSEDVYSKFINEIESAGSVSRNEAQTKLDSISKKGQVDSEIEVTEDDRDLVELQKNISDKFKCNVLLKRAKSGKIAVSFKVDSVDELEKMFDK